MSTFDSIVEFSTALGLLIALPFALGAAALFLPPRLRQRHGKKLALGLFLVSLFVLWRLIVEPRPFAPMMLLVFWLGLGFSLWLPKARAASKGAN